MTEHEFDLPEVLQPPIDRVDELRKMQEYMGRCAAIAQKAGKNAPEGDLARRALDDACAAMYIRIAGELKQVEVMESLDEECAALIGTAVEDARKAHGDELAGHLQQVHMNYFWLSTYIEELLRPDARTPETAARVSELAAAYGRSWAQLGAARVLRGAAKGADN